MLTTSANGQLTAKNLPRLDEDERLGPVIDHLASSFLSGIAASDYQPEGETTGSVVTAEMIDDVARKHFPACMRNLYERLKRDHHMKHFGRLQLGLFLKVGCPFRRTALIARESVCRWRKRSYSGGRCTARQCPTTNSTRSTNTTSDTTMVKRVEGQITQQRGTLLMLCARYGADTIVVSRSSRRISLERKILTVVLTVISRQTT